MLLIEDGVCEMDVNHGRVVAFDLADLPLIARYDWRAYASGGGYYAFAKVYRGGRLRTLYMHRLIAGLDFGDCRSADHIDGNGLNNRRANLRVSSHAENLRNQRLSRANTSGYKGVVKVRSGRWVAQTKFNGRRVHLGTFDMPEDAARAYDDAARRLFGEFARPNFPTTR